MTILVIASEYSGVALPTFEDDVVVACIGLPGRIGDRFQHLRDRGGVVFTSGMEPQLYLANKGLHFKLIIDERYNRVTYDSYKGIDHIPD